MNQNKAFVFLIMIWFSFLTIWAVNTVTSAINNNRSVTVQSVPSQTAPQQISTIQIDKDTVWVIDANSSYIKVITHDNDGFHLTQSQMSIQNH